MSLINHSSEGYVDYTLNVKDLRNKSLRIEDLDLVLKDSAGMLNLALEAANSSFFSGPRSHLHLKSRFFQRQSENRFIVSDTLDQVSYRLDLASRIDSSIMTINAPSQGFILNRKAWQLSSPELLWIDLETRTLSRGIPPSQCL